MQSVTDARVAERQVVTLDEVGANPIRHPNGESVAGALPGLPPTRRSAPERCADALR